MNEHLMKINNRTSKAGVENRVSFSDTCVRGQQSQANQLEVMQLKCDSYNKKLNEKMKWILFLKFNVIIIKTNCMPYNLVPSDSL